MGCRDAPLLRTLVRTPPEAVVVGVRTLTPTTTASWVAALRRTVKDEGFRDGWSVLERRGRVQIQRSWLDADGARLKKGISTQITWAPGCTSAVLGALSQLQRGLNRGLTLDDAAALLLTEEATASTHQRSGLDWERALQQWRESKISSNDTSAATFDANDGRRLLHVLKRVRDMQPENGNAFARLAPMRPDGTAYTAGSRERRAYVDAVFQFLTYCVDELGFDEKWAPPTSRAKLKGKGSAKTPSTANNAGKSIPLPESAIKPLLDSFPADAAGQRWRLAVGMIICFGLRGVELNYLQWRDGQLWCNYVKRTHKGETKPRLLVGIDPEDMPGLSQQLAMEWQTRTTELPPLGSTDKAVSSAISTYLRRRPLWTQMKADAVAQGQRLSVYGCRHRYSKALDVKGFQARREAEYLQNMEKEAAEMRSRREAWTRRAEERDRNYGKNRAARYGSWS